MKQINIEELNPPLNITIIDCNEKLYLLKSFFERNKEFVLDLETNVVNFYQDRRIRTIGFGNREEQYIVDLLGFIPYEYCMDELWEATLGKTQGNFQCHSAFQLLYDVINPVLDSNKWLKIGYNLEFEYITLRWCLGIYTWNLFDCYLAEKVIYCGIVPFKTRANQFIYGDMGFWGLDNAIRRYLGIDISKKEQTSFNLVSPLTEDQINYAALDLRLPTAIKNLQVNGTKYNHIFKKEFKGLQKENLLEAVIIENNAIPAFGEMHINGITLNSSEWNERIKETQEEKKLIIKELDKFFIPVVGSKKSKIYDLEKLENDWRSCKDQEERKKRLTEFRAAKRDIKETEKLIKECEGEAFLNYNSHEQLLSALNLFLPKGKSLPNTNDNTLKRRAGTPIIDLVRKFREFNTIIKRYGPYVNEINPKTNRVHANFIQLAAETGRPSSTKPNLFNIPKPVKWRKCFISSEGYKEVTCDHAGQELRILTEDSQEPLWVKAFNRGEDVHSITAEQVYENEWKRLADKNCEYYKTRKKCECIGHSVPFNKGTKNEKPDLRFNAKTTNFSVAYGATENKLSQELGIKKEEARKFLNKYFKTLNVLASYLQKCQDDVEKTLESRTMSGRRRLFKPVDYNDCIDKVMEDLKVDKKIRKNLEFRTIFQTKHVERINRKWYALKAAIRREGTNTRIQGTGADMLKIAMGTGFDQNGKPYLWHLLRGKPAYIQNSVYDELLVEVKDEYVDEAAKIIKDAMIRAGNTFVKSIPFDSEVHIADCWSK